MTVNFDKIGLTARLAAYMRQYSDIPFATDVAQRLRVQETFDKLLQDSHMTPADLLWYAPIFEVRYKSIAQTIRTCGAMQVIELASGLSLRGLAMTSAIGNLTYVETDLEDLTEAKAALVDELRRQHNLPASASYRLVVANALDWGLLQLAVQSLRHDQPIAVVNEGLFQYLSAGEMETVARNVHALLADFGGVWITPDFSLKEDIGDVSEQQRRFRAIVASATDRRMYNNAFDNQQQLQSFFDRLGLRARILNQVDVAPDIVCMGRLGLPHEILEQARPRLKLWILEPRPA